MFDDVMLDMDLAIESVGEEDYDASDEIDFGDEIDLDDGYDDTDPETSLEEEEEMMESMFFFGIDWDPATEGIRDAIEDAGRLISKKMKKLAHKIHLFVQKCVNWIREKFYRLLRVDTMTFNANTYNGAMAVIKMLDQSKTWTDKGLNRVKVMLTMAKAKTLGRMEDRGKSIAEKSVSDKFMEDGKKLHEIIKKKLADGTIIEQRLKESGGAKSSRTVTVRSAGLANQKSNLNDNLKKLNDVATAITAASGSIKNKEVSKMYSVISSLVGDAVTITSKRISVLNHLLVTGTRKGKQKSDISEDLDIRGARRANTAERKVVTP